MKKVIIASENPVKVNVAKQAFASVFPNEEFEFVALKSPSGVPDQPMNDETEEGALNRLNFIRTNYQEADYWISQEGGIFEDEEELCSRAWIAVCDKEGYVAKSSTPSFHLPLKITEYIRSGMELGVAADTYFKSINSKQGVGTIGRLTDGLIDRRDYYLQSAIIALCELKHQDWYK